MRRFLEGLADGTQRLVCLLLLRNTSEREICRELRMRRRSLELVKLQIAFGLRQAGIRLDGEDA